MSLADSEAWADDAAEPTYSVGELAGAINRALGREFGGGVWVRGEIQSWNGRGTHAYFQLAEEVEGRRAVIQVNLFADVRRRIRPLLEQHRLTLADGLSVRIFGVPDFWAQGGRLSIKMRDIDPRFTLGDLAMAREEVLRRLRASGRFDHNRALHLSPVPLRIGLVTSDGTAAYHDFVQQLTESGIGFQVSMHHTAVQGDGAEHRVAAAIARLGELDLDAIAVIRGGGSRTDLATFDAEVIAEAILACPVPVLTGIGHEIDRSIADEVAHTALKTPTACAAHLIDMVAEAVGRAEQTWQRIAGLGREHLGAAEHRLSSLAHRIAQRTHTAVEGADLRLGHRRERLGVRSAQVLDARAVALGHAEQRLVAAAQRSVQGAQQHLALAEAHLGAHDPVRLLARGWSITTDAAGAVVRSAEQVTAGTELRTRVADGSIASTVTGTVTGTATDADADTVGRRGGTDA